MAKKFQTQKTAVVPHQWEEMQLEHDHYRSLKALILNVEETCLLLLATHDAWNRKQRITVEKLHL